MNIFETKRWVVDNNVDKNNGYPQLKEAALLIKQNEIVAFPTETVYGLGANAHSNDAVEKIFQAKGRPSDNPLIVHIASVEQLTKLVKQVPPIAEKLIKAFWPGPLTLVLEKGEGIADKVTAGLSTVAVRMPDHPVAIQLIKEANVPVAAPSANVSGKPSPTTATHVWEDLNGKIAGIVDGGATGVGVESTVLDLTLETPMILRPGGVTREQIEGVIGNVAVDPALIKEGQAPKSPGLKYKHYAPDTPLFLVDGSLEFIQKLTHDSIQAGKKVGILTTVENVEKFEEDVVAIPCGTINDLHSVAQNLYDVLRKFDQYDLDLIYSEVFPETGVGKAIMNRLTKAASRNIVRESEHRLK